MKTTAGAYTVTVTGAASGLSVVAAQKFLKVQ
jgi:NADP-dependent 3-hydroxy acid dehydrogenase YdfG